MRIGFRSPSVGPRAGLLALVTGALLLTAPSLSDAHDIPATALVNAFIKPQGNRLRLIVRVPLQSIRDITIPQRDSGYLDFAAIDSQLHDAAQLWIAEYLELFEGDRKLASPEIVATRISLPSDRSFGSFDSALVNLRGPGLPTSTSIPWKQAMLDVLLEYPITSDRSDFSIRPQLAHLAVRTTTVLRYLPASGGERAFEYLGDPGLVRLNPHWYQAALTFVKLGFQHIMDGIDHLLFVFCLVIPFRRPRPLIAIITSFTVAHSITLLASALGLAPNALWFPPLIEALIAISILYMAFENIAAPKLDRRWIIAFGFGLVHGFGFSFALRQSLQFAGSHLYVSLVSFNVGVELGQLFVLAIVLPSLAIAFRYLVAERMGTILLSALVAHTAWHWTTTRVGEVLRYRFQLPALDASFAVGLMRALMLILIIVAVAWGLYGVVGRVLGRRVQVIAEARAAE